MTTSFSVLSNSSELLLSFYRYLPFGVILIDHQQQILLTNQWIIERSGEKKDWIGLKIADVLEPDATLFLQSRIEETLQIGSTQTISLRFHPQIFHLYNPRGEILPQSVMLFPAFVSDQIIGAFILIQDATERLLSESDLKRQIQKLRTLNEIERSLRTLDYQTCMNTIVQLVRKHFNVSYVSLFLLSGDQLQIVATDGWQLSESRTSLKIGEGITGWVAQHSQAALVNDVEKDPRYYAVFPSIRSEIAIPLIVANQCIGVLDLESDRPNAFTREDLELLELIASSAAVAMQNARIHREQQILAITDSLTGLYNRRKFFEMANSELERSRRFNRPLSILMLDLDHFKDYNDTYGHQSGDELLSQLASSLSSSLREFDTLARYGGDEFVLLLPEVDEQNAQKVAKRLISQLENMKITIQKPNGTQTNLTMSVGIASYPKDGDDVSSLIKAADRALYQAKEAGRNRTMIYNCH